jgi:hypothetical protein
LFQIQTQGRVDATCKMSVTICFTKQGTPEVNSIAK